MSMSTGHAQQLSQPGDWMTINGVEVNMAHVTSIRFDMGEGIHARVYLSTNAGSETGPSDSTFLDVKDASTANELRDYIDTNRWRRS